MVIIRNLNQSTVIFSVSLGCAEVLSSDEVRESARLNFDVLTLLFSFMFLDRVSGEFCIDESIGLDP